MSELLKTMPDYIIGLIDRVEDHSDPYMARARIYFKNGEELSVIRGPYSYGGSEGLFEIMPSCVDVFDSEDLVCGYLTWCEVEYYIDKIARLIPAQRGALNG